MSRPIKKDPQRDLFKAYMRTAYHLTENNLFEVHHIDGTVKFFDEELEERFVGFCEGRASIAFEKDRLTTENEFHKKIADAAAQIEYILTHYWDPELPLHQAVTEVAKKAAERIDYLGKITACTLGVGDGNGAMFVFGDHHAIKAAQRHVINGEKISRIKQILES